MAEEHEQNRNEFDEEYQFDDESDVKMDLDSMDDMEEEHGRAPKGADYGADGELHESAKDKYMDLIKNYWWVGVVGLALIYPAVHQLQSMFGTPAAQQAKKENVAFTEVKKPAPVQAHVVQSEEAKAPEQKTIAQLADNTPPPAAQQTLLAANTIPTAAPAVPAAPAAAPAIVPKNPVTDPFAGLSLDNGAKAEPAASAAPAAPPADARMQAMEDRLTKMEKTLDTMNSLQVTTEATAKVSEQNATQLKQLSSNLQDMQLTLNDLAKLVQAPRAQVVGPQGEAVNGPGPADLIVQATIPGRAWLMDKDGTLMTVREGDNIPGYGQVQKIDSVKGTVAMSNQVVFKEEQ